MKRDGWDKDRNLDIWYHRVSGLELARWPCVFRIGKDKVAADGVTWYLHKIDDGELLKTFVKLADGVEYVEKLRLPK